MVGIFWQLLIRKSKKKSRTLIPQKILQPSCGNSYKVQFLFIILFIIIYHEAKNVSLESQIALNLGSIVRI